MSEGQKVHLKCVFSAVMLTSLLTMVQITGLGTVTGFYIRT